jgi:uncharacterized protein involved in exopolysaccharide biosynthesis
MVAIQPDAIELTEYHPWRRIIFFLVGFGVCAAAALAWSYASPAEYNAVSQLRIVPASPLTNTEDARTNPSTDRIDFLTEVQVLTSRAVLQDAISSLRKAGRLPDLGPDPVSAVQHLLRARPIGQTQVLELSATGRDPQFLTRLLTMVAQSWRDRATHIYEQQVADEDQDLNRKADDLHRQSAAARARLNQFRDAHGILAADDEDSLAEDLQELSASYAAALASLGKTKTRLLNMQTAAPASARLRATEEEIKSSQSEVGRLSRDLSTMKKVTADFVVTRPEYNALQGDLERAEKLENSMLDSMANLQAARHARAPRLDILQAAQVSPAPANAVSPMYASIGLAGSLAAGVLAALFSKLLDGAPAVAWTTSRRRRYSDFTIPRIENRAGPMGEVWNSGPRKLLPAPRPE